MLSDAPYFLFHIFISRESKVGAVHMAEIMILNAGDGTAGADDAAGRQEKARALLAEGTALWATRRAMGDGLLVAVLARPQADIRQHFLATEPLKMGFWKCFGKPRG